MISDLKYFSFLEGLRNSNSLMSYLILPFPLQITEQVFCMKTRNCFPLMVEKEERDTEQGKDKYKENNHFIQEKTKQNTQTKEKELI